MLTSDKERAKMAEVYPAQTSRMLAAGLGSVAELGSASTKLNEGSKTVHYKTQGRVPGYGTIVLRRYDENVDFDFYLELVRHPTVRRFLDPVHSSVVEEINFLRRAADDPRTMIYTIMRERDSTPVGTVMLTGIDEHHTRAKVSRLIIAPGEQGKGYGKEALRVLSRFAFSSLRLRFLYCYIFLTNENGRLLFLDGGFEQYGRRPAWSFDGTDYVDELEMSLTAERYDKIYSEST